MRTDTLDRERLIRAMMAATRVLGFIDILGADAGDRRAFDYVADEIITQYEADAVVAAPLLSKVKG